jgi:hypothetical protein
MLTFLGLGHCEHFTTNLCSLSRDKHCVANNERQEIFLLKKNQAVVFNFFSFSYHYLKINAEPANWRDVGDS